MAHVSKVLRLSAMLALSSLMGGVLASAEIVDTSELPSVVEGLAVVPGDGEVTLTWDAATDDTGVEGYYVYVGLLSVDDEGSYTFPSSDAGNSTTYTVENLSNGVTYYFAVTAYDADGNESEFYSNEVEATPESSEIADYTSPTVKSATALTSSLVEVEFSEAVELPSDPTSAFALTATDGTALQVIDAYLSDDPTTVFIVTDVQDPDSEYELTAGIGITDTSGNPIESGTSDTAFFTGSGVEEDTEEPVLEDTDNANDAFMVEEIEATEVNELELTFSQDVASAEADSFKIQLEDDASEEIEVLAVSIDDDDATKVTLVTEEMEAGFDYVLTMDELVFNSDGEALTEENMSVDFTSLTLDLADLIAPEDITDLLSEVSGDTTVLLSWTASADTAGDLAEYWLRQSMDGGVTFDDALTIASTAVEYEVDDLTAGETYTFKVTAVDESGNESEGVLTTVTLPESGPELLVLGALSLLGAAFNRKKKNQL